MYYYVLRGNFMPVHEKASKIAKDSILTISLAGLLVVAYLLILMYTYNSLTQAAENEKNSNIHPGHADASLGSCVCADVISRGSACAERRRHARSLA